MTIQVCPVCYGDTMAMTAAVCPACGYARIPAWATNSAAALRYNERIEQLQALQHFGLASVAEHI